MGPQLGELQGPQPISSQTLVTQSVPSSPCSWLASRKYKTFWDDAPSRVGREVTGVNSGPALDLPGVTAAGLEKVASPTLYPCTSEGQAPLGS